MKYPSISIDGSKPASINERPILYRFHQLYTHGHKDIEIHNADKFHFSIVPKDLSLCEIVIDFSIRLSPRFLAYHARRKSIKRIPGTTNFQASILILLRTHTCIYIYINDKYFIPLRKNFKNVFLARIG